MAKLDKTTEWPRFETFQGKNKKYYWHLVARNGRITADGGQGLPTRSKCEKAIEKHIKDIVSIHNTSAIKAIGANPARLAV